MCGKFSESTTWKTNFVPAKVQFCLLLALLLLYTVCNRLATCDGIHNCTRSHVQFPGCLLALTVRWAIRQEGPRNRSRTNLPSHPRSLSSLNANLYVRKKSPVFSHILQGCHQEKSVPYFLGSVPKISPISMHLDLPLIEAEGSRP
jgi:hypothetical protein